MSAYVILIFLMLFSTHIQHAKSGIGSSKIPACVITNPYYSETRCPTPLYTSCGFSVCCSQHHYCCNYYYAGVSCCRRSGFSIIARRGEVASVVLGAIAWAGIVCVVGFLTCPRIYYTINRKVRISFKNNRFCKDKTSTEELQMK